MQQHKLCEYNTGYVKSHVGLLGFLASEMTQKYMEARHRKCEAMQARKAKQRSQKLNEEYCAGDLNICLLL